jgi:hypothetical protein
MRPFCTWQFVLCFASSPLLAAEPPPLLAPATVIEAQSPVAPVSAEEPPDAFTPSAEFQEWITKVVREQLPNPYEKKKNWGHQAKAFDGLSVQLKDGQLLTHRKFKLANDGTWQMYRVTLKNPEEKFAIRVAKIEQLANGKVGLEVSAVASLEVFVRQAYWEKGLQLYSLSAEADARVRLWARCEVATRLDPTRFPPDVYLDPEVVAARFELPEFKLRRIGHADGPLVRSLSHAAREALEDKLKEDNAKLVVSLNKQIAKQEKKLKLSLADVMSSKFGGMFSKAAGDGAGQGSGRP